MGGGDRAARLSAADRLRTGASGLRARPTRVVLSALGIATGIAAMVAAAGLVSALRAAAQHPAEALGSA
ncbi:hypothetical protein [Nocardiopsis deserti]|uniref:hypothetical protein n=1 Tax=Nocardiopsis deserti TaxID=2605988 RepID=UPI0021E0E40A|nr:hypothetical protein [Nocardiopsis deserti]